VNILAKLGEITLVLDKDVKKEDKVSLNDVLSWDERNKKDLAFSEDRKKGDKIKLIIETA